ncbi:hypothetical protein ACTID9_12625 [Brevibacillus fluminis]|uniref:hypothetical protein n=1 Tax=Brevibacillus fluminis TaxID=511487 RepID=UPI003F8BF7F4
MKKLIMLVIAFVLVLAPAGLGYDSVDAKGYKSGKKSFNSNTTTTTPNKTVTNENSTVNKSNTTTPTNSPSVAQPSKGGFMKGLLVGGLAGMLFGSLFGNMGAMGAIFGFLINMMAIVAVLFLIRKAFLYFKAKQVKREVNPWRK